MRAQIIPGLGCRLTVRPCLIVALAMLMVLVSRVTAISQDALRVTSNFSAQASVLPNALLVLNTSRPVDSAEGQLAVLVGDVDISNLCEKSVGGLTYNPRLIPLPLGETSVVVYLVSRSNQWTEIARFPLLVEEPKSQVLGTNGALAPSSTDVPKDSNASRSNRFKFIPSISANIKTQSVALFFPESSRPTRINATDLAVQARFQGEYAGSRFGMQNQFELSGSSVQSEAIRFGELGNDAMQLDLAGYLMQYRIGRAGLKVGHVSFGTNRHLINSFSSRGLSLTVPINKRFDFSVGAANGTSIVGFDNFLGLTRSKHNVLSATLGVELLTKRPGGLRVEVSALKGSRLPAANFNQRNINDAETSRGGGFRFAGSDSSQRLRFDAGFARSRYTNPADPLLYQGRTVVPVRPVWRNARYLDLNFDILRGYKLVENRPLNLSIAYRHERVDPLYRSVAAFASADRLSNQMDLTGSLGEISFGFSESKSNDNLGGIRSILKTENGRTAVILSFPMATLFSSVGKTQPWLPRVSYNFDRTHQFAAFVPINGDFFSPANIPDQVSLNQSFAADWQLSTKIRLGYRFNHSFQDSRQPTRERSDLLTQTNGVTAGFSPNQRFDIDFDLNAERASDFDRNSIATTLRVGTNVTWRMTNSMVWTVNTSTTGAGDRARTNERRDVDFSAQYSWRFLANEKSRWHKVQGQFFLRYANRYASAQDRFFGFNNLTKFQIFNAGLNLIFF